MVNFDVQRSPKVKSEEDSFLKIILMMSRNRAPSFMLLSQNAQFHKLLVQILSTTCLYKWWKTTNLWLQNARNQVINYSPYNMYIRYTHCKHHCYVHVQGSLQDFPRDYHMTLCHYSRLSYDTIRQCTHNM